MKNANLKASNPRWVINATDSQINELTPIMTSYVSTAISLEKREQSFLEHCRTKAVPATHFISPEQGPNREASTVTADQYASMKLAVLKGLPKLKQHLVLAPETLSDAIGLYIEDQLTYERGSDKAKAKTAVLKEIGSRLGKLRKLLEKNPTNESIETANKSKGTRAPQQPTGPDKAAGSAAKVLESIQQAAKRAQAIEEPEFDVVKLVNLLAKAQQIVVNH